MSLYKTGIVSTRSFVENGINGVYNRLLDGSFSNYNTGSISGPSNEQYTVVSPVTSSTWGSGFNITNGFVIVPYGAIYRVIMEVYVPTKHSIQVDINNTVPSGATIQGGNDNDTDRTGTSFSIPAATWTTITWGSQNIHGNNTTKADICVYDGVGLITSADTASVTWYIRNARIFIGYNTRTTPGIGNNVIYSGEICEY